MDARVAGVVVRLWGRFASLVVPSLVAAAFGPVMGCLLADQNSSIRAPSPPPQPSSSQLAVSVPWEPLTPGRGPVWFALIRYSPNGPPPMVGPGEARAWVRVTSTPGDPEDRTPFVEASYSTDGPEMNFGAEGSQKTNFVAMLDVPTGGALVEFVVQDPGQPRRVIDVPVRVAEGASVQAGRSVPR
jgi:hypothetical protein